MDLVANEIHFLIACLCYKRGGTLAIFTTYWINTGRIHAVG